MPIPQPDPTKLQDCHVTHEGDRFFAWYGSVLVAEKSSERAAWLSLDDAVPQSRSEARVQSYRADAVLVWCDQQVEVIRAGLQQPTEAPNG